MMLIAMTGMAKYLQVFYQVISRVTIFMVNLQALCSATMSTPSTGLHSPVGSLGSVL